MEIIYNIKDMGGQFDAHSPEELRDKLLAYYTVDGYSAEVTIDGDLVRVKVDQKDLEQSQKEFNEITTLCEHLRVSLQQISFPSPCA